ncbi:MAG: efflux RND transporter periplasmic adaptor subunit [Moorellaceae bacterium]
MAGALVALALTFNAAACGIKSAKGSGETVPVKAATATRGKVQATVEVVGSLLPVRSANVISKLAGQVSAVYAEVGDVVKAGQLLVEIDPKELKAQLQQAEAAVEQVKQQTELAKIGMDTARLSKEAAYLKVEADKVALDNAQKSYDRVKALVEAGAAPQSQLDDAETRLKQAQKQYEADLKQYELYQKQQESAEKQYAIATGPGLAQAEAAKNAIQVQMSNAEITSPLTGIVTNRYIQPGEVAGAGVTLLTVAETTMLKLQGTVSQEVVPLLAVGQKVSVAVDALPGKEFQGEVTQVGPVAASTGQRFPVEITVANPGELKPGMTAKALFRLEGPEGVLIPAAALRYEGGETLVFVIENSGTVRRRSVVLGLQNEEQVTVLQGLVEGEMVAVTNVGALQDRMAVVIQ